MKNKSCEIELSLADVRWAADTARSPFERWESQQGYYSNHSNSHFRFADRKNLAGLIESELHDMSSFSGAIL